MGYRGPRVNGVFSLPAASRALISHPQRRSSAVRSLDAYLDSAPGGTLAIRYVLEADLDALRIPPSRNPRHADLLWQHTCFELFIQASGGPAYIEFNFSPSGEWATYAFARYREATPLPNDAPAPSVTVRRTPAALELEALVCLQPLDPTLGDAELSCAISAVIEDRDGALSYWALAHPASQPDFHHAQSFVLTLPHG